VRPAALRPLRHRSFRLLAGGQLASNVGDACYAVALPWYVLADRGGALLLGTVLAAYGVPRTVLVAFGGQASDRWRPWTVMIVADALRAAAVAALAAVAAAGPADAAVLVPVAAVLGAGEGLFVPGSLAIVPSLLPDENLQAGNALISGGMQLATMVGPAIGGAVVALLGPAPAFAVDAGSFVISAVTLTGIRGAHRPGRAVPEPRRAPAAPPPVAAEPPPTLRHLLRTEPALQVVLLVVVAANLGIGGMAEVALPALAHGPLHAGADGYGGLVAAFGGGALAGTVVAAQARRARRPALLCSAAFLVAAVSVAVVPYLGGAWAAGAALVVFGVTAEFGNVIVITAFQRWAPPAVLGRVMGIVMLAAFGAFPVSVLLAGLVVRDLQAATFFPLAAAALAAAVLGGLTQRSWRVFGVEGTAAEAAGLRRPEGARKAAASGRN
jgi:MFS family permease